MSRALEFESFPRWKKGAIRSSGAALWENREALDKYLKRLEELMAEDGDETAIQEPVTTVPNAQP